MIGRDGGRFSHRLGAVGLALYAIFLVASPFEHHDLSCELRTPQHCTSCTSTQLGSDPQTSLNPGACRLADAGQALAVQDLAEDTLLAVRSTGRSPPVNA